ncbi:hypothetical protein JCM11641_002063 [Rhodosporidiobolus odoratus]
MTAARLALLALTAAPALASISPMQVHPQSKRATREKAVFAHVMFGEVPRYTVEDHAADMVLAAQVGIDAFAINTGHDPYEQKKVSNFFKALEQTGFKAFFSFDLLHYNKRNSSEWIKWDYLNTWGRHENYYQIDGKAVVSTFGGNQDGQYLNGESSFEAANAAWNQIFNDMKKMEKPLECYFAPFWLKPLWKSTAEDLQLAAVGNWFPHGGIGVDGNVTAKADKKWKAAAEDRGIDYWAPVGAHFSVHQISNRNYVYKGGDFLLPYHYEALINLGDAAPDYIEFITWSDWGESTYMGPLRAHATPPHETVDTSVYVDGHDHTPYALLSAYYTHWYKTGSPPEITSEALFFWHRGHPLSARPSNDPLPQPDGASILTDTIYSVVMLPKNSKVTKMYVTSGGKTSGPHALSSGVNKVMVDFNVGDVYISVQDKSGKEILGSKGQTIVNNPKYYDYNYYAFMAPADLAAGDYIANSASTGPGSGKASTSSGSSSSSDGKVSIVSTASSSVIASTASKTASSSVVKTQSAVSSAVPVSSNLATAANTHVASSSLSSVKSTRSTTSAAGTSAGPSSASSSSGTR